VTNDFERESFKIETLQDKESYDANPFKLTQKFIRVEQPL